MAVGSTLIYLLMLSVACVRSSPVSNSVSSCTLPRDLEKEIAGYKPIVDKIIRTLTNGTAKGKVWEELAEFVDTFGNRLSGTKNLENAIDYMLNKSKRYGLDNVHGEPVQVVHWERGTEEAWLVEPRRAKIPVLGLGGSVATPAGGITAEVMVVNSFDELKERSNQAEGKIVVFNNAFESYGKTVKYRQYAAVEAAKVGAVASLVRSISPFSLQTPHTGWQDYSENVTKIPTASVTIEDAQMLRRMYLRGTKMVIELKMEGKMMEPSMSRNSVMEVEGREAPGKAVILSGHLDSWDVGVGAMDDGGGAFISWYSLVLLKKLGLVPRRTVRAVLWTGEEQGLIGAFAYQEAHKNEEANFTLVMESDEGTFNPQGLSFSGSDQAACILQEVLKLLDGINASQLERSSDVGSDIMVWSGRGVPLGALKNANQRYFWFHHSEADRMTVEDPDTLDRCTAVWAAAAYVIADLSVDLPR